MKLAKRRLSFCEDQVKVVKRWILAVRQELNEFEGQAAKMTSILDSDIPRAVTTLERMLRALDKYAGGNLIDGVDVGARSVSSGQSTSQPADLGSEQDDASSNSSDGKGDVRQDSEIE